MTKLRAFLYLVVELSVIANLLLIFANLAALVAYGPIIEGFELLVLRAGVHALLTFLAAGLLAHYPLPIGNFLSARLEYAQARLTRDRSAPELVMD